MDTFMATKAEWQPEIDKVLEYYKQLEADSAALSRRHAEIEKVCEPLLAVLTS